MELENTSPENYLGSSATPRPNETFSFMVKLPQKELCR